MSEQATVTAIEQPLPSEAKTDAVGPQPGKVSPAQDLRDVQMLLTIGIFPGNMAPGIVKAFNLLDKMCVEIESAKA